MTGVTLGNSFDGLTPSGTTVTTANSGTVSGAPFDTVTIGSGATVASDSAHAAHGPFSLKVATGGTSAQAYVQWDASLGTVATLYWRAYVYLTANPASNVNLVRFGTGSGGGTLAGAFRITVAGKVSFIDSNQVQQLISTASVPLNAWFRLEGYCTGSATAGQAQLKMFTTSDDNANPDETDTSLANLNTAGQITAVRYGIGASAASIGPFWLDDIGASTGGYMGPIWSTQTRVGASVYNTYYGNTQPARGAAWDGVLVRDYASPELGVQRCYYTEGQNPADDGQDVVGLATSGVKCCITFRPWRDGTNAYSGAIPGQGGLTYKQEFEQLTSAMQLYFSNGITASDIEIVLWHEANIFGANGPFGSGSADPKLGSPYPSDTTLAEAEQNYANYVNFYGPAISQFGVKLTYVPSLSSNNVVAGFFPGTVNADLAPYFSTVGADYYYTAYSPGGATLGNSNALANTWGLKLGIWEWGVAFDGSVPVADVVTWITGSAAAGGQMLQVFQARANAGQLNADIICFNGAGGGDDAPDNIKTTTNASIIAAMQELYDDLAVLAAAASMQATFSLTASGQDTSGHTHFGSADLSAAFSLSATGSHAGKPSAFLEAIATLSTAGGATGLIIQEASGGSTFDYGISSVEISTQDGSTLVVVAGWDLSTTATDGPVPAVRVNDSAVNSWVHVATTSPSVTGSRCSAWICPNAQAIEWLSVSLTTFASSLAYTVLELSGDLMPPYYSLDIVDAVSAASAPSLTLRPGTTIDSDIAFAVFAVGAPPAVGTPAVTGPAWQTIGAAVPAGRFVPYPYQPPANTVTVWSYLLSPGPGTSLQTTFSLTQAVPVSGIVFAIRTTVYAPYQPNPDFPLVKVECGFGFAPGDPTQAPPEWTDITNRVTGSGASTWISSKAGRQYELASPEAGTLSICVDNHDSAFDPTNTGSPFWPYVLVETPVRVSAFWDGSWYPIAFGWVERWPQQWPDLAQWGTPTIVATDVISTAAAVSMFSALNGDILLGAPYILIPANEQYLSSSNGLAPLGSGLFTLGYTTVADAQGLLAQNYARTNQRNGMYVDGNGATTGVDGGPLIAATGQTTNLLGSADTGFGTDAASTAPTTPASGPGIVYTDPNLPDPLDTSGVTVSFWVIIPEAATSADLQPVVFTAYGTPSNYVTSHASLQVLVQNYSSADTIQITLADGSTFTAPFTPAAAAQQIVLAITSSAISVYINGALAATEALSAGQVTAWSAVTLGCPAYAYGSGNLSVGNFTAFDLAIYGCVTPVQQTVAQYATGTGGQTGVDATVRMAQILAWANLPLARAGRQTFSGVAQDVQEGPAYSLAGATANANLALLAASEAGMLAGMPTGALYFLHRWALFNQSPVAVFGDAPDPDEGEVPYLQGQAWDYDVTYLNNTFQVTQVYGENNLFTAQASNVASQVQYFARTPKTSSISTTNDLDPIGQASWLVNKYSQPQMRVSGVTIDAATNPSAAFGVILSLQQGQAATVTRTPQGGNQITENVIIQRMGWKIGPSTWRLGMQLAPYVPEGAILQLDNAPYNVVGANVLP